MGQRGILFGVGIFGFICGILVMSSTQILCLGGMQDYNYGFHNVLELTFELSCCKFPAGKELPQLWQENRVSMLQFLLQINNGTVTLYAMV